ncbi:MAG: hypothetical protein IJB27_02860 [Clostridia bacterium]|nr:hypothetical protein [Clostridia bacterium]
MRKRCVKMFAVCLAMLLAVCPSTVAAESCYEVTDPIRIEKVDGVKWFPIPEKKQYDDAWEVQCVKGSNGFQRYDDDLQETGYRNFLDTEYGENGSLTLTRNGNDETEGVYGSSIRTLWFDEGVELDIKTADTLYFDFDVQEGTQWRVTLRFEDVLVNLTKVIADAAGCNTVTDSDGDGPSGHFSGTVNLQTALRNIAAEMGTESAQAAAVVLNKEKTYVPGLQIACIGEVGASLTLNRMHISTADDTSGDRCRFVDFNLLLGEEPYVYVPNNVDGDETEPENNDPVSTEPSKAEQETPTNDDASTKSAIGLSIGGAVLLMGIALWIFLYKRKNQTA